MSSRGERFLVWANRVLPAPALPGDVEPMEYARWEYRTSGPVLRLWDAAVGGDVRAALDVGCGLGGKTHRLREHAGPRVAWTALDIDREHVRQARSYWRDAGIDDIRSTVGDASALPFADASFDRIVTADALEHLQDPRAALREFQRCLRADGRLVLLFNPWGSPRGSHLGDLLHLPWCQLWFSRETLERATLAVAEERAAALSHADAEKLRAHARDLSAHFRDHVHPTRIADLRAWLREDHTFSIEHELRFGPGRIGTPRWLQTGWGEEWLSATYAAVLRPWPADRDNHSVIRSSTRSSS